MNVREWKRGTVMAVLVGIGRARVSVFRIVDPSSPSSRDKEGNYCRGISSGRMHPSCIQQRAVPEQKCNAPINPSESNFAISRSRG